LTKFIFEDNGKVKGVESEGEICKCDTIVGDPSYFKQYEKTQKVGQIIRCICILDHPIADTYNSKACQIIIPQKQVNRKNDIYVCCISDTHNVCSKGKFIAIIATNVETSKPIEEIKVAFDLIGKVEKKFVSIIDTYGPKEDGKKDGCYVSTSVDASTHFDSTAQDALDLYERIMGKKFDITKTKEEIDKELTKNLEEKEK